MPFPDHLLLLGESLTLRLEPPLKLSGPPPNASAAPPFIQPPRRLGSSPNLQARRMCAAGDESPDEVVRASARPPGDLPLPTPWKFNGEKRSSVTRGNITIPHNVLPRSRKSGVVRMQVPFAAKNRPSHDNGLPTASRRIAITRRRERIVKPPAEQIGGWISVRPSASTRGPTTPAGAIVAAAPVTLNRFRRREAESGRPAASAGPRPPNVDQAGGPHCGTWQRPEACGDHRVAPECSFTPQSWHQCGLLASTEAAAARPMIGKLPMATLRGGSRGGSVRQIPWLRRHRQIRG
jgi:hypothetical protein